MKYRPEITQDLLKLFVHYDPDTGILRRTHVLSSAHKIVPKEFIPKSKTTGYLTLNMFKRPRLVHRLAFVYMTGREPDQIDHINGDRSDNRWCNLREVTDAENKRNLGVNSLNKSGVVGVYWYPRYEKWEVTISRNGQHYYLGRFYDFDDAVSARKQAELELDFHPNHGARPAWGK